MKKIKLLISLLLINFCAYSQTIPEVPINQFTQAGYLNSKYYPIGWSEDERYFALMILSESNYASLPEGHGFDFLVKDVVTDKDAYIKSYSGYDICEGKFDAYGQGECDFSAKGIFELHKATFTEALNKYNINTKTPLAYSTFPIKNAEGESISIQNYKVEKDGYISMETLTATNDQQGSKTILQSTYDSNFRRLASEIVGAFVSPSKERLLVIQKYTSSGIEGDRDIELNFIGCHTQKGYQFDDDKVDISNAPIKKDRVDISDHAYVIATNVNIRNKPNVSESKVLFQLNKVEWVKYQEYPDSAMTNWTGFDPTPVEIIDSTVTDGNKWYKIKGAKLTKEEIDNLSKWGDWDTVRDSLFNLDDMGNKIRQDNSNREHWIYHTLVHRFQNNSFKDGKYSASKVAEASYKKAKFVDVNDYVNFTIDGYNVKGELGYHPAEMDGITCDIYGNKSTDGKHLNLKSTCYSEGMEYEGGTYKITLMDNNAFKVDFTSSRGNFGYNFYRYEFEEDISIDRNIIPNESVGLITSSTTKSALNKLYDKGNIRETVVFSYEGFDIKGTEVIFDNTADNITIEWNDGNLTPKIIRIKNPNSNWKTKEGVGIGSTIKEVEKANGKPFTIYGYEIDAYLAGTVKNWNSGNLQGLNLQFKITKEIPVEVYMEMMGDRGILSNNPLLEKAGLQVENITVEFNK